MPTRLLLIRHAATAWHGQGRVLGRNDVPLSDAGLAQARALADALAGEPISTLLCSPLRRTVQTAEAIAERQGLVATVEPRLIDLYVGPWEGCTTEELATREDHQRFMEDPLAHPIPGGETLEALVERAGSALDEALGRAAGGTLALVTHSDVVRVLLARALGLSPARYLDFRASLASVTVLTPGRVGRMRVLTANWVPAFGEAAPR